jgi:hypothetical protein
MAESAVHSQIPIEPTQLAALEEFARSRALSISQVVRDAIASYLTRASTGGLTEEQYLADPIWDLPEVGATFTGSGPDDLAEQHDTYLYGPDES